MDGVKPGSTIYKYMPLFDNELRFGRVLDIIKTKSIFVPHIENLNDPFEKMFEPRSDDKSENEQSEELGSSAGLSGLEKMLSAYRKLAFNCVLSFSKGSNKPELMWAHYASNWSGVKLAFTVQPELEFP